ncbi:MAG: 2-C-methyl-D-erythritol 4-phosphate cytidylyltransferase [Pirellulales bacterium]|jgi:2-C-methyl-D-erythritol 4-phosphate cytidylyltransferase|nr:2-C-methyl-D-erythritol 4-phosphate cytidylyltransferase [Pirellulales bacterium]
MPTYAVILAAAGRSSRFRNKNYKKPFAPLADRAVWLHSAERFLHRDDVRQVILVIAPEDREYFDFKFASNALILGIEVVEGGAERADSIERALHHVKPEAEFVAVHDAARPCLADEWIARVFQAAERSGAALLAVPVTATLKRVDPQHHVVETISRQGLWEAQTPQVFRRELLQQAYAQRQGLAATDDAQLVERLGHTVTVVEGSPLNVKITTQDDLRLAEQALKALPRPRLDRPAHPFADEDLWR